MNRLTSEQLIEKAQGVLQREADAVRACAGQMDENLTGILSLLLDCKGHVLVAGAGTSRAVAQRFAHLLSCCGTPSLPVNAADALHGGSGAIGERDVVYIISKGGHSAEINKFAEIARKRGAKIVAHTENPDSPLAQMSDAVYSVHAEGDVDPYGMIATGSSLVNCAACDVLCILLLELRGYSKEAFGATHPGGAVGRKLEAEGKNLENDR
jgi:D-arabinose 5-phosphate isomerase GutQ